MCTKKLLRNTIRERLKNLTEKDKTIASNIIESKVLSLIQKRNERNIFVFMSDEFEPNTHAMINKLLASGYSVSVPVIVGDKMIASVIDVDSKFRLNKYNILEPCEIVVSNEPEIVIVPLVGFDDELSRLGRGRGYYDRYLSCREVFKIGIAFDCQRIDRIAVEEFDIPLDVVVTEKECLMTDCV